MKILIPTNVLKFTFLFLFLASTSSVFGQQISWDGGGDMTSWDDPLNWEWDMVPPADSFVLFEMDATVTGIATTHARINVSNEATVTFDLDLTIGDGVAEEHGLVVGNKSTVNLGTGSTARVFTISTPNNKQGIPIFNSSDSATVNIALDATVNIAGSSNGINIVNINSTITNDGTINFDNTVKNGIKSKGIFVNNGTINMDELITDGIQEKGGTFDNNGMINITKPGEDCIELIDDGMFTNYGVLTLVAKDSAGSGNNTIAVGTDMAIGTFVNESTGTIDADGGDKDSGRAISVNEMGSLENYGQISLTGGDDGSRLYSRGTSTNEMNAVFDLTDGRANVNMGSFTNTGLIISTRGGAGIFSGETATLVNNAFFQYLNSGSFSSGMGTITDNGISLNQGGQGVVDAAGSCTVDIAEVAYEYNYQGAVLGTADNTGSFTFPNESVLADSAVLRTTIEDVKIKVTNICEAAVMTTSIFSPEIETIQLQLYPSLITYQNELNIDLKDLPANNIRLSVFDMNGQLVNQHMTYGVEAMILPVENYRNGMYIIKAENEKVNFIGKFLIAK